MIRILFLSNVPSPYMVGFFNELGKISDLTVIFEKRFSSERGSNWNNFQFISFRGIVLRGLSTSVDSAFCPQILKYLRKKKYDHIIITNPSTPTGIISILTLNILKIPYIIESEGGFPKSGKGIKEIIKKNIFCNANFYFSTTTIADKYFLKYGAKKEKILRYPFTSLSEVDILSNPFSFSDKIKLREELNITGKKIALAVGRFIPLKNFDVLIKSWRFQPKDFILYIIGEGEEKENYLKIIRELKLTNVFLKEFMKKEELFNYYKAADLLIHPTSSDVWGLVINEAMACALPIICTNRCIAGLELVQNFENGFIINVGVENEIIEKAYLILNNDSLIIKMAHDSLQKIRKYTFEEMSRVHLNTLMKLKY